MWLHVAGSDVLLGVGDRGADVLFRSVPGLGQRVITRIEILAILCKSMSVPSFTTRRLIVEHATHLLDFLQDILVGRELSIEAEELPLLLR